MKIKSKIIWTAIYIAVCLTIVISFTACGKTFNDKTLNSGRVGMEYSVSVASGKANVWYYLSYGEDNLLPQGLDIDSDGVISGIPEEAGTKTFIVTEEDMTNYENYREAKFTITIEKGAVVYTAKELPAAVTGDAYVQELGYATGAPAITYSAKNNNLPKGLQLSPSGQLSGVPEEATDSASFTIIASAAGCDSAEATFTLKIREGEEGITDLGYIVFEDITLADGIVGGGYNESVRKAYGVPNITYRIKYVNGVGFPKGLTFNTLGVVSGTPADSTLGQMHFQLTAAADGYESVTVNCYLTIYDKYVETNLLEVEYTPAINYLKGAGYSSSPTGTGMIEKFNNASNGRALSYLHTALSFDMNFTSDRAAAAKITLGLSTDSTHTFTPDSFVVELNGTEIAYGSFTVELSGSGINRAFYSITLSSAINLLNGDNTLTFQIKDTEQQSGEGTMTSFGPIMDYVRISDTDAVTGWRPKVGNIN